MQQASSAIAVLGPTGVGKTEIAIHLARIIEGEIVSCDSVQLYKHLDIGSAKPTIEERELVKHYLVDEYEPSFQIDVGIYKSAAENSIQEIQSKSKIPIISGGTGMYFNSLYYGLFDAPARDDSVRAELERRVDSEGLADLYSELIESDPAGAGRILPNDKRRIIRALEVLRKSGRPISELRKTNKKLPLNWLVIGLNRDRKELYERIERRVDTMLAKGLVEETRAVIAEYGRDAFALGSIGYRHARSYIEGEWDYEKMVYELKLDTRHYAKRQLTWFRKIPGIVWFHADDKDKIELVVKEFLG